MVSLYKLKEEAAGQEPALPGTAVLKNLSGASLHFVAAAVIAQQPHLLTLGGQNA